MNNLDQSLFNFFYQFTHRSFIIDAFYVFLAEYLPYLLLFGLLFLILSQPGWRLRIFLLAEISLAVILSRGLITEIIRFFYPSPRPFVALELKPLLIHIASSFPSGHGAFFFAMATVIFLWNKKWGIYYYAGALVICVSRMLVGVNWPFDILGGIAVGVLSGFAVHHVVKPYFEKIKEEIEILASRV
jgi:undecaprenyl-diphosphatase